ncbi:MAG: Mov34/MPN/PAD-1 family protein [Candidatus Thorarchaeota archaeon]
MSRPRENKANRNLFEQLLKSLRIRYNKDEIIIQLPRMEEVQYSSNDTIMSENDPKDESVNEPHIAHNDIEIIEDFPSYESLEVKTSPVRVKISVKAYIKMALHALKYANDNISKKDWVEVIGLMTGNIENGDTPLACLNITDAFPIGHGTDVNVHIRNPQSFVKVYKELQPGTSILGWYHSHPSYSPFMSQTDYDTQLRYQKLSKTSNLTAPVALVIDPTMITTRSYGFKIFRFKSNMKELEEQKFNVINLPLESLPELLHTLIPLAKGRAMFLEYDHE